MVAEIWTDKSEDLLRALLASPGAKMLSPGRRTCEMLRPVLYCTITHHGFQCFVKTMTQINVAYLLQQLQSQNLQNRFFGIAESRGPFNIRHSLQVISLVFFL